MALPSGLLARSHDRGSPIRRPGFRCPDVAGGLGGRLAAGLGRAVDLPEADQFRHGAFTATVLPRDTQQRGRVRLAREGLFLASENVVEHPVLGGWSVWWGVGAEILLHDP